MLVEKFRKTVKIKNEHQNDENWLSSFLVIFVRCKNLVTHRKNVQVTHMLNVTHVVNYTSIGIFTKL